MTDNAERLAQLRRLLPATSAGIYFDTATAGPLPAETAAAMREADDWELRVGRVWEGRDEEVAQRQEEARAVVAALIGADPAEITLTYGRDHALALAQPLLERGGRVIDATYQVGVHTVDVNKLNADAIAFACDRWMLGPESTAAVWFADRSQGRSLAIPRTAVIGLARSVGWLEMYVGLEWIYERTAALAERLYSMLAATDGVEVVTPRETLAAIVNFRLKNWRAEDAVEELSRRAHALLRPMRDLNAVRASVAWFNTEDELDTFASRVAELAGHTPESLPRRPTLIVLADQ